MHRHVYVKIRCYARALISKFHKLDIVSLEMFDKKRSSFFYKGKNVNKDMLFVCFGNIVFYFYYYEHDNKK